MSIDEVVAEVTGHGCPLVEMTGGEPLLQKDVYPLMERLHDAGLQVLVETGGHRSIEHVPACATVIMDVKCPGSGEAAKHDAGNFARLRPHDEVKFVIRDRADYDYARDVVTRERLAGRRRQRAVLAGARRLDPKTLSEWVLADRLAVRVQLQAAQVHLGPRRPRRVRPGRRQAAQSLTRSRPACLARKSAASARPTSDSKASCRLAPRPRPPTACTAARPPRRCRATWRRSRSATSRAARSSTSASSTANSSPP